MESRPICPVALLKLKNRGDTEMSLLPIVPVLLLVLVAAWLFWPIVIDPIARNASRGDRDDRDRLAESLFDAWSEHGSNPGLLVRTSRG